jgi:hypothetical protein
MFVRMLDIILLSLMLSISVGHSGSKPAREGGLMPMGDGVARSLSQPFVHYDIGANGFSLVKDEKEKPIASQRPASGRVGAGDASWRDAPPDGVT